jgi:lipoate synthase
VAEYVVPEQFDAYREFGLSLGFKMVFSGPFVRSSYMADRVREEAASPAMGDVCYDPQRELPLTAIS